MLASVWRTMLALWLISVLIVISLPWSKYDGTPHWKNLQLVPFEHFKFYPSVLIEAALNVVAFIPVGYLAIRSVSASNQRRILLALVVGSSSSICIECYQLFCQDRVPSTTDVVMNFVGTGVGVCLAFAIDHMCSVFLVRARRLTA